ncbi:MAG: FtsQ-type POTRA domain-containing protein [Anaerolineales bacterium]|jgi:hypothetical protein
MTASRNISRAEFVRKRRSARSILQIPFAAKRPDRKKTVHPVSAPRRAKPVLTAPSVHRQARAQQYAFSLGRADVRAPALTLPQFGPRWVSALAMVGLVFLLITLWTSSTFTIQGAELYGNQRLSLTEINASLGLAGQPIFKAVPSQIEASLLAAYPGLAQVNVRVGFPNRLVVTVTERTPLLAWNQDGQVTWIDDQGIAFKPDGQVQGLIQVTASGTPPQPAVDPSTPLYERPFIAPETVAAMTALVPFLPSGVSMTYDPQYGLGWQDPHGWSVYFGNSTEDIQMKLRVYQTIVASFTHQGIQPTLISMEYLDAPFYK